MNDSPSSSQPAGLSPESAAGGRAAVPPGIGGHVWRALRGQAPLSRIALLLALLLLLVVWLAVAAEGPLRLVRLRLNGPAKPSDWF